MSEKAQVLRTSLSEIRSTGRATQGVTIFRMDAGDNVASIACVEHFDNTEAAAATLSVGSNGTGNGSVPGRDIKGA